MLRVLLPCLALWLGVDADIARACSVPVFRYALERWPADDYLALVFHRGALTPEQSGWARDLGRDGLAGNLSANVSARTVDLAITTDPRLLELWQQHARQSLPAIVLLYPPALGIRTPAWRGPLTPENVRRVLDSPTRRAIAERLLRGDCAVWLLVESGDARLDTAAATTLTGRLEHLEKTLRLPELNPADVIGGATAVFAEKLAVRFSTLRISREHSADDVLVQTLLHTEDDLEAARGPIAFPLFGRGRALPALVGAGINQEMIDEACRFVTGACSCVVKGENPGIDLLMAIDWTSLVEPLIRSDPALPPLAGIAEFASARSTERASAPAVDRQPETPPERSGVMSPLIWGIVLGGGAGGVLLLGATWWLLRHRG